MQLGSPEAAAVFLAAYEERLGRRIHDIRAWDVQAAALAHDRVETWLPNYHGIGLTDMTPEAATASTNGTPSCEHVRQSPASEVELNGGSIWPQHPPAMRPAAIRYLSSHECMYIID